MNIDATLVGQLIFILAIVMAVVGFYLGKRKTQTPFLVSALGFVSALVPPLALIFLIVLVLKGDVQQTYEN